MQHWDYCMARIEKYQLCSSQSVKVNIYVMGTLTCELMQMNDEDQ